MGGVSRALGMQPKAPPQPQQPSAKQIEAQETQARLLAEQEKQIAQQETESAAARRARAARLSGRNLLMLDEIGVPPGTPITQQRMGG